MNVLDRQNSIEHLLPNEIEKRSFEIISKELKERGIELPKEEEMVTKRVIHTSADFEYTKTLVYSKHAVRIAKDPVSYTHLDREYADRRFLSGCERCRLSDL